MYKEPTTWELILIIGVCLIVTHVAKKITGHIVKYWEGDKYHV